MRVQWPGLCGTLCGTGLRASPRSGLHARLRCGLGGGGGFGVGVGVSVGVGVGVGVSVGVGGR